MTTALVALAKSRLRKPGDWLSSDIDNILIEGDKMYSRLMVDEKQVHSYLYAQELPTNFEVDGAVFSFTLLPSKSGFLFIGTKESHAQAGPYCTLTAGISESLQESDELAGWFFVIGGYGLAIIKSENASGSIEYFSMDSHSRDGNGLLCSNANLGRAVLVTTGTDALHIVEFIDRLARSLNVKDDSIFELTPAVVTVVTKSMSASSCPLSVPGTATSSGHALASSVSSEFTSQARINTLRGSVSHSSSKKADMTTKNKRLPGSPLRFNSKKRTTDHPAVPKCHKQTMQTFFQPRASHSSDNRVAGSDSLDIRTTSSDSFDIRTTSTHSSDIPRTCSTRRKEFFQSGIYYILCFFTILCNYCIHAMTSIKDARYSDVKALKKYGNGIHMGLAASLKNVRFASVFGSNKVGIIAMAIGRNI